MRTRTSFPFFLGAMLLVALACDGNSPVERLVAPEGSRAVVSAPPIEAPSNPNAVLVSSTRIDVSWSDQSGNETSFEVHRSTSGANGTFSLLRAVGANVTISSDAGLAAATQYCYKVRAVRVVGSRSVYSTFTSSVCATTPPPPLPPPTAASDVSTQPLDSTTVRVRWYESPQALDGFRVFRSTDGATWVLAGTTRNFELTDTGVPNAEIGVCYRVVAFNASGDAPASNTACTGQPAAPTILSVVQVDSETTELTWTDNSAVEDSYQIWGEIDFFHCSGGTCDGGGSYLYWMIAELPANSTSYRCSGCAGVYFSIFATKAGYPRSASLAPLTQGALLRSNDLKGTTRRPTTTRSRPAPARR